MTYGFRVFLCKCHAHLHNSCWQRPPPPLAPHHSHSPQNSYCHMQPHWSKILHIQNESRNGRCSIPTRGALQNCLANSLTWGAVPDSVSPTHVAYPNPPPQMIQKNCLIKVKRASAFAQSAFSNLQGCAYKSMPATTTRAKISSFPRVRNCYILF